MRLTFEQRLHIRQERSRIMVGLFPIVHPRELGGWEGSRTPGSGCPHGHEWTLENTAYGKDGARRCRACNRIAVRRWQQERRAA